MKRNIRFSESAFNWLDTVKYSVEPSTHAQYSYIIRHYLMPEFGNKPLRTIKAEDISTFTNRLCGYGESKALSPRTVKNICAVLHLILSYGEKQGISGHVDFPGRIPAASMNCSRCFDEKYIPVLLNFAMEGSDTRKIGIVLCLFLGLRCGELCALQWNDIDLREGIIHIRKTVKRIACAEGDHSEAWIIGRPKTRTSLRDLPLPPFLWDRLKSIHEEIHEDSAFFLNGRTDRFVFPRSYERSFKNWLAILNIPEINLHSMRHSFATRCLQRGCDIKTLSELLGHSSANITLQIYVHTTFEQKRNAINLLQETPGLYPYS